MDASFNNVVEGMRPYFLGLPKQAQDERIGQPMWNTGAPLHEEGTPAQSGAPAPSSRPPSTAAAPPSIRTSTPITTPPRPPSEPIEPEPHIIHKATVMREAAEKRREQPEIEDEEEPVGTLSPPSHIIRKPPRPQPSPAPAPAAPCPSPVRPPSNAPLSAPPAPDHPALEPPNQYRPPLHHVQPSTARPADHFAPGRPPDPYSTSRPPEPYVHYRYETNILEGTRSSRGPVISPQPSSQTRHSPHSIRKVSVPQHPAARLRDIAAQSPPSQRYHSMQTVQPQPPPNDRVPPIHHPQVVPPNSRQASVDGRSAKMYPSLQVRETSPYSRPSSSQYDRLPIIRKYDPQHAYPGYRPTTSAQPAQSNHHQQVRYKHAAMDIMGTHYAGRSQERPPQPLPLHPHDVARLSRSDYISRPVDTRGSYHYATPATSTSRYGTSVAVPVVQNTTQCRATYRPATAPKTNYDYSLSAHVQTSPVRSSVKPGYPNQARMTVSVTSIVHEMQSKQKQETPAAATLVSQSKQKRESPLDLSVKTVKNSADSSTTQDEVGDTASTENKCIPLQHRPSSSHYPHLPTTGYVASHKVDFAPNFNQYGERSSGHNYGLSPHQPPLYEGTYDTLRPVAEPYAIESPHHFQDRSKYTIPPRTDYPKIDLTIPPLSDPRQHENRPRDDRHIIIEERKHPSTPIVNNIPEKLKRYETWASNSRIEQDELIARPVYNYAAHKHSEGYQSEQKHPAIPIGYREHHLHSGHRYSSHPHPSDLPTREIIDYHNPYHDKNPSINSRHHVIPKNPIQRDTVTNKYDTHSGFTSKKNVLSILRRSLETKQIGYVEPPRLAKQIPDLIVIDDADDSVIEITDITDTEMTPRSVVKTSLNQNNHNLNNVIQMPKAIDSLPHDYSDYNDSPDPKRKSPENDVASRIRTKAELKVMPPSQDNISKPDNKQRVPQENEKIKMLPRKTHLFNQIREDNLRLESVIKKEKVSVIHIPEVKTEPMNIEEIEKDAEILIKTETILENLETASKDIAEDSSQEDLDWANTCDSFMEQLKSECQKKKSHSRRSDTKEHTSECKVDKAYSKESVEPSSEESLTDGLTPVIVKQEPIEEDEVIDHINSKDPIEENINALSHENEIEKKKNDKKIDNEKENSKPIKSKAKIKSKSEKNETSYSSISKNKDTKEQEKTSVKTVIKLESDSTDDDEPLIKSKILKQKKESERFNFQLLKELSKKSAYVKLECCDVNKNSRKSIDSALKDKEEKHIKERLSRKISKSKGKLSVDNNKNEKRIINSSSDSEDDVSVASRLRMRKIMKGDDGKTTPVQKTPAKSTPSKKHESSSASNSSTPVRKPTFGDGSFFHPGWEEELYRYKRSLRMPTRLIAIPRGGSGGPFARGSGAIFTRGSTSLPDLDPAPLSPAPSSAPSAATDDLDVRRPDKLALDSDLESNSSYSAPNKLHYDSEASTSTVLSTKIKRKSSSIVDVLIKKCRSKEDSKKEKKSKNKDDKTPKVIPKKSSELLPTPSLGLVKNGNKGNCNAKKEKVMEGIFYLGAFRKETVTAFRNSFIKDTGGLIGATEEFAPVVLKSRTRTESRVLKQRATIKEVFGDERPASAPPTSCRDEDPQNEKAAEIKKEPQEQLKPKFKPKKIVKGKLKRRSSSIRDGLRSTKSLKRNDAKGRLLRLKKRNSLMISLNNKKIKGTSPKHKNESSPNISDKDKSKDENSSLATVEVGTKRRLKRLFGRRKFSSGFDYIRKKKKIVRREEPAAKIRRPAAKPSPESVQDIRKEIKGWFINKSIGETHLHRAARLGYTDCVAFCLEKMESDPSAKDNAGFTPLHVAAAKGHVRIARLLLQYGANVSAAAQGGIRPLHEACENCHVEVIRLLLSYGADPLLGTYAGQTPEDLTDGPATTLLRLHMADVQGRSMEPWRFPLLMDAIEREELGCDPLSSPPPASPPPPPDSTIEIQCTEAPLPPFYSLRTASGQPSDGLWCLLQDITNLLQIKSKESLLKQIHCGSGSPKELLREIRTQEFLERAQCHQLLCAGEKVNVRASKVSLVRVTDKLRQLLKIETVLVS